MKYLNFFLLFFFFFCSEHGLNPDEGKLIQIEVVDVSTNEIWLKVTVDTAYVGYQVRIDYDGDFLHTVGLGRMTKTDTVAHIIKSTLEPGRTYTIDAAIVEGAGGRDLFKSNSVKATILPYTNNDITWQIDTIGTFQTNINGIWGSSPDNVYAVGWIKLPDRQLPYNIIHWNGTEWTAIDYAEGEPFAAFGFTENDIWIVGDGGGFTALAAHWDGEKWRTWEFNNYTVLTGVWGKSSEDIYAVGLEGQILHFNGSVWSKMESPTDIPLRDISGYGEKIYAVGGDPSTGEGVMLELVDGQWEIIYKGKAQLIPAQGYSTTVWCINSYRAYLYNDGIGVGTTFRDEITLSGIDNLGIRLKKIRGTDHNNIFAVGPFGFIAHWNGSEDRLYPSFDRQNGSSLYDVMVFENNVFAVGMTRDGRGIVYRGVF